MSHLNIYLFILALGLWSSIYILKFREEIKRWYLNKFDNTPPPLPPDGKIPEVSLPFNYAPPPPANESGSDENKTAGAGAPSDKPEEAGHDSPPPTRAAEASSGTGTAG
ncbi:hypothetical protein [Asaia lannensis]|uniref:hypothetical protein n=1 Tax=Asaia lannensis TaxID=415421 RepID=UPI001C99A36A